MSAAGQGGLREASILNRATGQTETWKPADGGTFGVFVFAGYVPATNLVRGVVELDDYGYVVTHGYLETSVPGVYAAGDLRAKNLRQVVTATADGAIAAVELERYAKRMSEETGLTPQRPGLLRLRAVHNEDRCCLVGRYSAYTYACARHQTQRRCRGERR